VAIAGNQVAVGIDLGTTRSVVAHLDNTGRPCTVPNLEGNATTPSVVYFDRKSIVVGKEALKAAEYEPDRVVQFAKRDLGKVGYRIPVAGQQVPPEVIQALILRKLKNDAIHRLGPIDQCVVTVPAYFNEPRRKATQDAGRLAGLNVVDIINEPTAAALAYGIQRGFVSPEGRTESLETVLVYDLGGGTFDVTVMEILGNDYSAIATGGDVYLGGIDWDLRIADYVAEQFLIQFGKDPRKDPSQRQRLMTEAEDVKRSLSQRDEVVLRFFMDGDRIQLPLDRAHFETLCCDLIDRTLMTTRKALKDANRTWKDVSRLLLVGGSSRMPMVQDMLESESNLKVDRSLSADESVAHGAAIYAGILLSTDHRLSSAISVHNVNSHDLGLLGLNKDSGGQRRSMVIPRNSRLPVKKGKRFATSRQNQSNVSVKVAEGGDDEGRHSTLIGNCVVRDLPPDLPAATPVDVFFNYDNDGRLHVTATLPTIGTKAEMTIERESGLSAADLIHWAGRIEAGLLETSAASEPSQIAAAAPVARPVAPIVNVTPIAKTTAAKPPIVVGKSPAFESATVEAEASDEESESPELQTEEETSEEPRTSKQRLLHPDATQRRRLIVLATNVAVHAGVIFILAAIFLPSEIKEEFMMITSAFEPETAQTEELEMMEVDQPVELAESVPPAETFVESKVESMDIVDININDLELASIQTSVDVSSKTASAMAGPEFGGRSKAGRSAMVAKMGGSAASEKAVQQGLMWLAHHQAPDGGWSFDHTGGECKGSCSQPGSLGDNCRNAATGMAILAMLGAGNTPFRGDFQASVLNGVKFLLAHSSAAPAGLDLRGQHAGNTGMYTHAIAATALCETLSMLKHEVKENVGEEDQRGNNRQRIAIIRQLEPAASNAIKFIINAQSQKNGSWGYDPGTEGDTSILGWQVMALKSAVHADIPVNPNSVRGANAFLDQVQAGNGFYGYQSPQDAKPSTTAIGLVCRMLSGVSREEPRLKMAVETLSATGPDPGNMYYNYYATQVMLHYGGETWSKWNSVMRDHLVSTQQTEGHLAGSWNISDVHGGAAGRLYMTCLCTMTLEVYYRHLPLYGIPDNVESDSDESESTKPASKSKKK